MPCTRSHGGWGTSRRGAALTLFVGNLFVAGILAGLGVIVFLGRPGHRLNQVLAAILVLQGAADVAFELMRAAPDAATALVWARIANWYQIPVLFLYPSLFYLLFRPHREPRWLAPAAAAPLLLGGLCLVALVVAPERILAGVTLDGRSYFLVAHGPGEIPITAYYALVQAAAVVLAARVASSPRRTLLHRRQASLVGLGFGVLVLNAAAVVGFAWGRTLVQGGVSAYVLRRWETGALFTETAYILAALAVALLARRLLSPLDPRMRRVAATLLVVSILGTLALSMWSQVASFQDLPVNRRWASYNRFAWVLTHAVALTVAATRYGLAGVAPATRRRLQAIAQSSLLVAVLSLPVGITLYAVGRGEQLLVVGLALGLVAAAVAPAALPTAAAGLRSLVRPDGSGATGAAVRAQQLRLYADAARHGGDLSRLRRELGITDVEHDLVLGLLPGGDGQDGSLLGRYRVLETLGAGASGTATLALDPVTGERVVIKRFHAGRSAAAARREIEALGRLHHPNVVPLLDVERAGDEVFLVLPHMDGGSLQDRLRRAGPMAPPDALRVMRDVLEGLAAVHAAGIIHGDIKPANILLQDGRALLADFGAARFNAKSASLTGDDVVGTLGTIAPEVLTGSRPTAACDVYGAAATLYRLLTGEHYVELTGPSTLAAQQAILLSSPRLPHPRVPAWLEPALVHALDKKPETRPPTAAFRAALGQPA